MIAPTQDRPGRRTRMIGAALAGAALMWLLAAVPVFAADATLTAVQQLQAAPVLPLSCNPCHANIADNKLPNVNFSHASHISYQCSACHTRFPHQPTGTAIPKMPSCWSCHSLRHGPQGIMAKAQCEKCHSNTKSVKLRPKNHVADWKGKPHVGPAKSQLSTLCMMCHTKAQCDLCHERTNISWETTQAWSFDTGNGCLSCHGSQLPRLTAPVTASGLDASAHRDITCPRCHPDFRYDDAKATSKLWNVNAGLACADCHATLTKELPKSTAAKDWKTSIHGQKVLSATKLEAPTCSGCHGGHAIERLKTQGAKNRLRLSGQQTCGRSACHAAAYDSYSDWWHGAAYKRGALDAPACWTCHPAHTVKAKSDPKSSIHAEKLPTTCGQDGCHNGSKEAFVESWRSLPHGRASIESTNPIVMLKSGLSGR